MSPNEQRTFPNRIQGAFVRSFVASGALPCEESLTSREKYSTEAQGLSSFLGDDETSPLLRVNAFRSLPRRAGTANVSQKGTTSYTYSLGVSSIESLHQSTQLNRNTHTQQICLCSHSIA